MTLAPLRYRSTLLGATVVIPAEFVTDLASTPRLLITWFLTGGRAPRPAVVHDYAYVRGLLPIEGGGTRSVTKAATDAVFHEAMRADPESGTNAVTAWLMWAGVRLGGRGIWAQRGSRAATLNPVWSRQGWPETS